MADIWQLCSIDTPRTRRPVRTRHHAAPPLEFVKAVGAHLPLADDATCSYVHRDPDVLVLRDFIKKEDCDGLLKAGRAASLEKSPVEYAGWTEDAAELLQTWASGPAAWIALAAVLVAVNIFGVEDRIQLAETGLGAYVVNLGLAAVAIFGFLDQRKEKLQALRTSKSVALRGRHQPRRGRVLCKITGVITINNPRELRALTLIKYDPATRWRRTSTRIAPPTPRTWPGRRPGDVARLSRRRR